MKRKTVKSSNIVSVGYSISNKVLELEFNGGSVYHYKNVDLRTVVEFVFAESLGKYFSAKIRKVFDYVKGEFQLNA